jgi:methyl-accepting chemotaxis protein
MGRVKNFQFSLRLKLSLSIILPVLLASMIFAAFVVDSQTKMINREIVSKGMSIGSAFYGVAVNNISKDSFYTLEEGFQTVLKTNREVKYLMLVNNSENIVVHSDSTKMGKAGGDKFSQAAGKATKAIYQVQLLPTGEKIYDVAIPVNVDLEKWGVLRIGLSNSLAQAEIDKSRYFAFGLAIVLAGIGLLIAFFLSRLMITPIKALVAKMNVVAAGDFTGEIYTDTTDETGILAKAVNTMLGNVRALIGKVQQAGNKVTDASEELAGYSAQTFQLTDQVAEAIEKHYGKSWTKSKAVMLLCSRFLLELTKLPASAMR